VAYDEELAARIRDLLAAEGGVAEKKMFGGLAFLLGGNMAVAASGQGGILVRVDPAESDELVTTTSARPMEMRGREMAGWLRVGTDDVETDGVDTGCAPSRGAAEGRGARAGSSSWTWGTGAMTAGMPVGFIAMKARIASVSIVVRQTVAIPRAA